MAVDHFSARRHRSSTKVLAMLPVGFAVGLLVGTFGDWAVAPAAGWSAASVTFLVLIWSAIGRMDADDTAAHSTREDPTRGVSDVVVLSASIASFGAVAMLLLSATSAKGLAGVGLAALAIVTVALSWLLVHTLFTLRYAALYYDGNDGGIDFNQEERPRYIDFAYLSFTIGMTYQVSDTNLQGHTIRATALRHGLLSYLFGSVVLATIINLVAGLSSAR